HVDYDRLYIHSFHYLHHPPALLSFPTRRSSDLTSTFGNRLMGSLVKERAPKSTVTIANRIAGSGLRIDQAETFSLIADSSSRIRSEEHTSELQSLRHLVCRLLLEKKKIQ